MRIDRMLVEDLRIVQTAELRFAPGLNFLVGANGAGKTSILEAVHLLSYGRSFRAGGRDVLVRRGADRARVFAELRTAGEVAQRLGIERTGMSWRGRINDAEVAQLSDLFRLCAVCCFEPGSHELISGSADMRRSMFDWGVFHVEPDFLPVWRRYQRALRQRNVLLREQAPDEWFVPWELEMAAAASTIDTMRRRHAETLGAVVLETAARILPEFTGARLRWADGWKADGVIDAASAVQRLADERGADRERGFSRRGPHRADWSIGFDQISRREYYSRGQEKLVALTMVLAQLSCLHRLRNEWPILLLDDLASELDRAHQTLVLEWLRERPIQVLITGVAMPDALGSVISDSALFHVEQGRVRAHH